MRPQKVFVAKLYGSLCRRGLPTVRGDFFIKYHLSLIVLLHLRAHAAALRRLRFETPACGRVSFPDHSRCAGRDLDLAVNRNSGGIHGMIWGQNM